MNKKRKKTSALPLLCVLIVFVLIVLVLLIHTYLSSSRAQTTDVPAVPEIQDTSADPEMDIPGNEASDTPDTQTLEPVPSLLTLQNAQIPNVEALSTASEGWGMGPDRDEFGRPVTAMTYEERYQDYSVDFIVPTEEKVIYLTFDEGYEYGVSGSILDTLKEKDVKAVFFVTLPYAKAEPELVQRMIDEGHLIGNHTNHHPSDGMPAHDVAYQTAEITDTHQYIKDNFNYEMCVFRFPSGSFSEQSLAVVNNCNYRTVFWSAAYRDWDVNNQPEKSAALDTLLGKLHSGAIYLIHAESTTNAAILGDFIDRARAEGYTIGFYADTLSK